MSTWKRARQHLIGRRTKTTCYWLLTRQYSYNWTAIAEVFNGSTVRVPTDRRLPWDVYDRWNKKFGPQSQAAAVEAAAAEAGPSAAIAAKARKEAKKIPSKFEGSKKKARHLALHDAIRKLQRKREAIPKPPGERVGLLTRKLIADTPCKRSQCPASSQSQCARDARPRVATHTDAFGS